MMNASNDAAMLIPQSARFFLLVTKHRLSAGAQQANLAQSKVFANDKRRTR